jgi:hypothetical protein
MRSLFLTVPHSVTNRKLNQRCISQRRWRFRQLSENVHEVSSSCIEHFEFLCFQLAVTKRIWVLRDRDDSLVFAQEEPVPDAFSVGDVSTSVRFIILRILSWFRTDVMQRVVTQTHNCTMISPSTPRFPNTNLHLLPQSTVLQCHTSFTS